MVIAIVSIPGTVARGASIISYEIVPVGDAGNSADAGNGYGSVANEYWIGRYPVTIGQYAAFLNAVAQTDTHDLYKDAMGSDANVAGIQRTGTTGSYAYSVIGPAGTAFGQSAADRPITYVSWFDAARFANWMTNGQPTGPQDAATTEGGAYTLNGVTSGNAPARNTGPGTDFFFYIPTENEWYKAGYYSPVKSGTTADYWAYATQSDTLPGNVVGLGGNQANFNGGSGYSLTQSATFETTQNYLTDVGAFTNSASYYGTFDQTGNVFEWNDLDGAVGPQRGLRGGSWDSGSADLSSTTRFATSAGTLSELNGFRLMTPVPEPTAWLLAVTGVLACGAMRVIRRRA